MDASERAVLACLDEQALVDSLVALVRIPSVGGSDAELEVQEHAADVLRDLDADVDRWDIDVAALREAPASLARRWSGPLRWVWWGRCRLRPGGPVPRWCCRATWTSYLPATLRAGGAWTRSRRPCGEGCCTAAERAT